MEALLVAATELAALLPPSRVSALAERIRGSDTPDAGLRLLVTTPAARTGLDRLVAAWKSSGMSGDIVAGVLMGASHARNQTQDESKVDLVWTGPTTPFVATRRTEQVLLDLIRNAKSDIFLVSFVAYDVSSVVEALNSAAARNIEIQILLETSMSHGGSLSVDPVATMRRCVPSAALYVWTNRPEPFADGRVHAKVAVADGRVAFLTSANLTGHAMEKNMEAGVLLEGGSIPDSLRQHLEALISTRQLQRV